MPARKMPQGVAFLYDPTSKSAWLCKLANSLMCSRMKLKDLSQDLDVL